jgi:large subunit ribosomal protein L25
LVRESPACPPSTSLLCISPVLLVWCLEFGFWYFDVCASYANIAPAELRKNFYFFIGRFMKNINLEATIRDPSAKVKTLRETGCTVGTVYGHGISPVTIQLKTADFLAVFNAAGKTGLIDLKIGSDTYPVLIHQYQKHTITRDILNVELYKVSLTEKITTLVPLKLIGEAPGIKLTGGFLFENLSEVEVECLPQDTVKEIEVDVTPLISLTEHILVKDLKVPSTIKVLTDGDTLIAKIQMPQIEKEPEVVEETAVTQPELVAKKKDEEEAAAEAK